MGNKLPTPEAPAPSVSAETTRPLRWPRHTFDRPAVGIHDCAVRCAALAGSAVALEELEQPVELVRRSKVDLHAALLALDVNPDLGAETSLQ